jgi:hypothetical protein
MFGFLEWLSIRENQKAELLLECANVLLFEGRADNEDIEVIKSQINGMFDDAVRTLVSMGKIDKPEHVNQVKNLLKDGYDWWSVLVRVMREYPYKGQDLYDAATHLAGDLWENVFNPRKYEDRNPPLAIFHRMASIRGQDIAFRFFGWRRKLKTSNYTDVSPDDDPVLADKSDSVADLEWKELQEKLVKAIEKESQLERNKDRGKRAVDVMIVKLTGKSKLYNKYVPDSGLDGLAAFYHVTRREMYDTLLLVYRAAREMAKNMEDTDDLLQKIMGQLPASLKRDPEEVILSFIPPSPQEISHSELFTKAYSSNRELKSLTFKQIIQNLIDKNQIYTRKDGRAGKHQTLYSLAS